MKKIDKVFYELPSSDGREKNDIIREHCPSDYGIEDSICMGVECPDCWNTEIEGAYSTAMASVKIKLTLSNAKMPQRANPTDAGADLISPIDTWIPAHGHAFIDFGVQLELPQGTAGFIYARSGLGSNHGIRPRNCVGVIDEKYRGTIGMMVENHSEFDYRISQGDKIAQLVIMPVYTPAFECVDELNMENDRNGGFGSTGK